MKIIFRTEVGVVIKHIRVQSLSEGRFLIWRQIIELQPWHRFEANANTKHNKEQFLTSLLI